jgi:hypothetical protein
LLAAAPQCCHLPFYSPTRGRFEPSSHFEFVQTPLVHAPMQVRLYFVEGKLVLPGCMTSSGIESRNGRCRPRSWWTMFAEAKEVRDGYHFLCVVLERCGRNGDIMGQGWFKLRMVSSHAISKHHFCCVQEQVDCCMLICTCFNEPLLRLQTPFQRSSHMFGHHKLITRRKHFGSCTATCLSAIDRCLITVLRAVEL